MDMPTSTENVAAAATTPPEPAFKPLTPAQIEAIRKKAQEAGIALAQPDFQRLPNKGIKLTIELPAEVSEPLLTWAETAHEDPKTFIQAQIVSAITTFVFAGMGSPE